MYSRSLHSSKEGMETHNPGRLPSVGSEADPEGPQGPSSRQATGFPAQLCFPLALPLGKLRSLVKAWFCVGHAHWIRFPRELKSLAQGQTTGETQEVSFPLWCALPERHLWKCFKYFLGRGLGPCTLFVGWDTAICCVRGNC